MKKFRTAKFLALSLSLVMVLAAAGCGVHPYHPQLRRS